MSSPADDLRKRLAWLLRSAAKEQVNGNFGGIDRGFDQIESVGLGHPDADIRLATSFWDGWIDSRNHEWQYYELIRENDWPELAHLVASSLEARRPVSDARILKNFGARPPRGNR